jgi:hypothetical protein
MAARCIPAGYLRLIVPIQTPTFNPSIIPPVYVYPLPDIFNNNMSEK